MIKTNLFTRFFGNLSCFLLFNLFTFFFWYLKTKFENNKKNRKIMIETLKNPPYLCAFGFWHCDLFLLTILLWHLLATLFGSLLWHLGTTLLWLLWTFWFAITMISWFRGFTLCHISCWTLFFIGGLISCWTLLLIWCWTLLFVLSSCCLFTLLFIFSLTLLLISCFIFCLVCCGTLLFITCATFLGDKFGNNYLF